MGRQGFWAYVKSAFKNQWNLLLLAGGVGAAVLSGHADVALPILAAAEMTYLVALANNPRFQHGMDTVAQAKAEKAREETAEQKLERLYAGLPVHERARYDLLEERCAGLVALATRAQEGELDPVADAQLEGVNKLLWVYLKLLHTKARLEEFLANTDAAAITRNAERTRQRLADLPPVEQSSEIDKKKRASLEDTLATLTARARNVLRAKENHDVVIYELERIATKLEHLAETAANRQDASFLKEASEADDVARSIKASEEALGELSELTGLGADKESELAPKVLTSSAQRRAAAAQQRQRG